MDLGLKGKVAIVTGAARGIGAATARRLAEEGAMVIVNDIREDGAQASTEALRADGFTAHAIAGDVTVAADVERLIADSIATFGGIHVLVNNAGFPRDGFLTKMSEADWDSVVDVILKGSFLACKAVMPHLIAQKWGRIVNISSRAYLGNPGQANYSAAKAGILGLTRALAIEEGRYNITVNAVAPGFIATEMVKALPHYEQIRERAIQGTPIARPGVPEDVAAAVAFLASDRAGFITAETLHVTGGRY